ncbi:MAG: hypothetical protein JNK51_11950 [Blastocatellia bacterium]|nr:hypothetical protein [Blastocatellia bacterium]
MINTAKTAEAEIIIAFLNHAFLLHARAGDFGLFAEFKLLFILDLRAQHRANEKLAWSADLRYNRALLDFVLKPLFPAQTRVSGLELLADLHSTISAVAVS